MDVHSNESLMEQLKRENAELRAKNDSYIGTIQHLSNEIDLVRKRGPSRDTLDDGETCAPSSKRIKREPSSSSAPLRFCSSVAESTRKDVPASSSHAAETVDISALPLEVVARIFTVLERNDLDRCGVVCREWHSIIHEDVKSQFRPRRIQNLKLIERNGHVTLSATSRNSTKLYRYLLTDFESSNTTFVEMKRLLKNSHVRRWIICNINVNDEFVQRLQLSTRDQPMNLHRLEMLACNLQNVSPDNFHRLLGRMLQARIYFIDGARSATEQHFSSKLLEQASIAKADDLTVYDTRALNDDEVVLDMGDDSLLAFIFGSASLPSRSSLYLDSPDLTSDFLHDCLQRFVTCEQVDKILPHVEFAHCPEQRVPTSRHVNLEYDHEIQAEWSARNRKTGRTMEARASRNSETDSFCHLTINILPAEL